METRDSDPCGTTWEIFKSFNRRNIAATIPCILTVSWRDRADICSTGCPGPAETTLPQSWFSLRRRNAAQPRI